MITENNQIEIVDVTISAKMVWVIKRIRSNEILTSFTSFPPQSAPDKVWAEIYTVKYDQLQFVERQEGTYTPAKIIPSQFNFSSPNATISHGGTPLAASTVRHSK